MIVTREQQRLKDVLSAEETLQMLIDRVRDMHLKDRLIVSVAVDGRVLVYVHKELELDDIRARFGAERYPLLDDKPGILVAVKR